MRKLKISNRLRRAQLRAEMYALAGYLRWRPESVAEVVNNWFMGDKRERLDDRLVFVRYLRQRLDEDGARPTQAMRELVEGTVPCPPGLADTFKRKPAGYITG